MANQINTTGSEEIDLSQMSRKIQSTLSGIGDSFFNFIMFVKRYIVIILILIIAGVAWGIYLDGNVQIYNHKAYVIPNFNSNGYLYAEVEQLNNKLKERDYAFFKKLGISNPDAISKIKVEPVVDVYEFVNDKESFINENAATDNVNFQVFRLLSEKGDVKKVMEDNMTAMNYKQHLITVTTNTRFADSGIITPILDYFNSNVYFKNIQQESVKSLDKKIAVNDTIIRQIDNVLSGAAKTSKESGSNLVYVNDNTSLDKVIKIKDQLVREQAKNQIDKINYSKIIKDSGMMANIRDYSATTGKMKYIIPLFLFLGFVLLSAFRSFFRKQVLKRKLIINE